MTNKEDKDPPGYVSFEDKVAKSSSAFKDPPGYVSFEDKATKLSSAFKDPPGYVSFNGPKQPGRGF
jgi:hypothetical protein